MGSETFEFVSKKTNETDPIERKVTQGSDHYELREPVANYNVIFTPENAFLSVENGFFWY